MARNIMIQGTMSNVGKSFVVTGLCRYFNRKGYKVAPFKSQNMALNSFITKGGDEIGRAQAVQAEAAGIEPDYRMNPILLKPSSDKGSQIILNGKVIGEKSAREYFLNKKMYIPYIMDDYESLASENDIIVIEGAGSPAEINLKKDDIVNMGLAKMVNAPVLLVGDINPGGVFAQLYGTMELLSDDERALVKGLIINKFRGEKSLLQSGLDEIERLTNRKVFGVLPYSDVRIEAEDSLVTDGMALKSQSTQPIFKFEKSLENSQKTYRNDSNIKSEIKHIEENLPADREIDLAIISLPWASNLTDLDPLELEPSVSIRYVTKNDELEQKVSMSSSPMKDEPGHPSCIIIPGTKNTMHDARWLFETGLAEKIIKLSKEGIPVIGICGGYQILGERLFDPHHVDGESDCQKGLGLLPIETVFDEQKRTTNNEGKINNLSGFFEALSGMNVKGYEIHMGQSHVIPSHASSDAPDFAVTGDYAHSSSGAPDYFLHKAGVPFIFGDSNAALGYVQGNVLGTYLHGIFENDEFRKKFLSTVSHYDTKSTYFSYHKFREEQFDMIADLIEQNLDMDEIYKLIGL